MHLICSYLRHHAKRRRTALLHSNRTVLSPLSPSLCVCVVRRCPWLCVLLLRLLTRLAAADAAAFVQNPSPLLSPCAALCCSSRCSPSQHAVPTSLRKWRRTRMTLPLPLPPPLRSPAPFQPSTLRSCRTACAPTDPPLLPPLLLPLPLVCLTSRISRTTASSMTHRRAPDPRLGIGSVSTSHKAHTAAAAAAAAAG